MAFVKKTFLLMFISLFLFSCASHKPDNSNSELRKVHLVHYDKENNVFLFRGGDPVLDHKNFAYEELAKLMHMAAKNKGVELPEDFYMIDFSLLFVERTDLSIEKKFFKANPKLGEFVNYPVFGNIPFSNSFERTEKEVLKQDISGNNIQIKFLTKLDVRAVNAIHKFMTTPAKKATAIYVHCAAGCDRTGEVIGGYRMQYLGFNIQDAYDKNTMECGRPENKYSKAALVDYCKYLRKKDCSLK